MCSVQGAAAVAVAAWNAGGKGRRRLGTDKMAIGEFLSTEYIVSVHRATFHISRAPQRHCGWGGGAAACNVMLCDVK